MNGSGGPVYIVLISGSTRAGSTNTAALRTAAELDVPGVVATLWERLVDLPAFVPDDEAEPPAAVTALRLLLASADAVVFCTPEYAGALPGSFKNLLDWTVGGPEMYRKPVAWVNASASPTRAAKAHESLETVQRKKKRKAEPDYMGTFTGARKYVLDTFANSQSALMRSASRST